MNDIDPDHDALLLLIYVMIYISITFALLFAFFLFLLTLLLSCLLLWEILNVALNWVANSLIAFVLDDVKVNVGAKFIIIPVAVFVIVGVPEYEIYP